MDPESTLTMQIGMEINPCLQSLNGQNEFAMSLDVSWKIVGAKSASLGGF